MSDLLERLLIKEEGFSRSAYKDSRGYWTIGFGKLIDARLDGGVSREEGLYLLRNEIDEVLLSIAQQLPWAGQLDEVRRTVVESMVFQLGLTKTLKFKRTLRAIQERRWDDAADAMLASLWAQQTPRRVERLAAAMRAGDPDALFGRGRVR